MKALELFDALNIPYQSEGHKHCRPGWVNMPCPFCTGNPGMHLGFDIENEYFRCWRCGWHPIIDTLYQLTKVPVHTIKQMINTFGGRTRRRIVTNEKVRMKAFCFPSGTNKLSKNHKKYLENRGFDPDYLEQEWGLKSTGVVSSLDASDYCNRIIIPIHWGKELVSFQGRTPVDKDPKYKTCPKDRELIHHKHILYGKQTEWKSTGICVEGVTDVWRFGNTAFATFGIEYKLQQVKEMCTHFTRIAVVFDDDPQAVKQANKLVSELRMRGVSAFRVPIVGDPGEMPQEEADKLVASIIK